MYLLISVFARKNSEAIVVSAKDNFVFVAIPVNAGHGGDSFAYKSVVVFYAGQLSALEVVDFNRLILIRSISSLNI